MQHKPRPKLIPPAISAQAFKNASLSLLLALGGTATLACGVPEAESDIDLGTTDQALSFSIPIGNVTVYPTYTGKVHAVDPNALQQSPTRVATVRVPLASAAELNSVTVTVELEPATIVADGANVTVPASLINYEELAIDLVSPSGREIRVSDPVTLRYAGGAEPAPFPSSSFPRLQSFNSSTPLEVFRPTMGSDGLPLAAAGGQPIMATFPCGSASWIRDSSRPERVFPRCSSAGVSAFKTANSALRFASKSFSLNLDVAKGDEAFGDWTLIVTDTRPLLHDARRWVDAFGVSHVKPATAASRFSLKTFKLMPIGRNRPLPTTPKLSRRFENEPALTGPIKQALVGATSLVASGLRLEEATVWFRTRRVGPGPQSTPNVVLRNPAGVVNTIQFGLQDGTFYEKVLGSNGGPAFPGSSQGAPMDGTWKLEVWAVDASTGGYKDYSSSYELNWGIKAKGPATTYVARQELDAPVVLRNGGIRTFTFNVQAGNRVARDLWLELGTDNMWAFRHFLTVTPPSGAAYAMRSCNTRQAQLSGARCLRLDASGRALRAELPRETAMTGTWTVQWEVAKDTAGATGDLGVQMAGGCAPSETSGSIARTAIAIKLLAQEVSVRGLTLGLGETRLTDNLFAHSVLDAAETRPRAATVLENGTRYSYVIERVRFDREFWAAYGKAREASPSSTTVMSSLARDFDAAMGDDNLRKLAALEDGVFAAWAPRGRLDQFSGSLRVARGNSPALEARARLERADMGLRTVGRMGQYGKDDHFPVSGAIIGWLDGLLEDGGLPGALTATAVTVTGWPIFGLVVLAEDAAHLGPWGLIIEIAKSNQERLEAEKTEQSNAKADTTTPDGSTKAPDKATTHPANPPPGSDPDDPDDAGDMCPPEAYECTDSRRSPAYEDLTKRVAHANRLALSRTVAPYAMCEEGPCGAPNARSTPSWLPPGDPNAPYVYCGATGACGAGSTTSGAASICPNWREDGFTDPSPLLRLPGIPYH